MDPNRSNSGHAGALFGDTQGFLPTLGCSEPGSSRHRFRRSDVLSILPARLTTLYRGVRCTPTAEGEMLLRTECGQPPECGRRLSVIPARSLCSSPIVPETRRYHIKYSLQTDADSHPMRTDGFRPYRSTACDGRGEPSGYGRSLSMGCLPFQSVAPEVGDSPSIRRIGRPRLRYHYFVEVAVTHPPRLVAPMGL
jgi:hypothetical protein